MNVKRKAPLQSSFTKYIKYRSILIFSVFTFFFAVFTYKAFKLQVSQNNPKLQKLLDKQLTTKIKLTPQRGEILDSNLKELALSTKMDSLYLHPHQIKDKIKVINYLAKTLKVDKKSLSRKVNSKRRFVWIKRLLDPITSQKIQAKKLPGLHFVAESKRFYPNKHLAAQAIGFVGYDSKGLEGLELKYDNKLLGEKNLYKIQTDALGRPILAIVKNKNTKTSPEMLFTNYISKENIVLTIDKDLQYWAERELEKAVIASEAPRGEVIIMDPNTGKIIAIANYPYFNPNNFAKYPNYTYKNRTVTDMFDPGSTFKLFTVAAALDTGKIKPNTKFFCENGVYRVRHRTKIREAQYKKFGELTVTEIIQHSSNIGTVKIAELLDNNVLYEYIEKFGFNQKTGIDLPGESPGRVREPDTWNEVDKANISFGQGISTTSIQLITAFSAIVNGGTLYRPYIVEKIIDNSKQTKNVFTPHIIRKNLLKPRTITQLKKIMATVVEPEGTGRAASIKDVSIGGKTGTAQKFNFEKVRYYKNRYVSSFIGSFPLEKPKYTIFVKIDDPIRKKYASESATPAFKQIALYLLGKLKKEEALQVAKHIKPIISKKTKLLLKPKKLKKLTVKYEKGTELFKVPDLNKLPLRQVLRIFNGLNLEYNITGSGRIIYQSPKAGTYISKNSKMDIKLKAEDE